MEELYKLYGEAMINMEIAQAKVTALKQELVKEINKTTGTVEQSKDETPTENL